MAKKIKSEIPLDDIDVVMPIPESSIVSGTKVAEYLDKQIAYGFVKNRYVGRTFIMPEQNLRKTSVKRKLKCETCNSGRDLDAAPRRANICHFA